MGVNRLGILLPCCILCIASAALAGDWPMASADARRSASTAEHLPLRLQPAWSKQLPPLKPAWPDQTRLQGDGVYRPIVLAGRVIVGSTADGKVYFAAGIWPFMGIFIHCLDAATGKVVWTNSGDGSSYVQQPHDTPSFGSVAPQGALALAGDRLFVPNGRAVPACYDRDTGKLLYFNLPGKVGGDTVAVADDADVPMFFNGGLAFDLKKGKPLATFTGQAVVSGNEAWAITGKGITAYNLAGLSEQKGFKPGPKFKLKPEANVHL